MLLHQVTSFLLDVLAGLLSGACLLRLVMQARRIPFGNPVGRLVLALTDWLVLPLRRMVPAIGRWDSASAVAAYLIALLQVTLLWLLWPGVMAGLLPVLALLVLARLAVSALIVLILVYVVLSWVRADSPVHDLLARLVEPLLRPVRRVLPLIGGIDLSPLVVLVLLQVLAMVLGHSPLWLR